MGMFTFIPQVLNSTEPTKGHFEDLFTAISIAAFSLRGNASHAAAYSRWYYGKGVAELRRVLGDKDLVKSDSVLASTILLGFYEVRLRKDFPCQLYGKAAYPSRVLSAKGPTLSRITRISKQQSHFCDYEAMSNAPRHKEWRCSTS